MKVINKKAAALLFNLSKMHTLHSPYIDLLKNTILTIIQTGFIISEDLNQIYLMQERDPQKLSKSILSKNSIFTQISKYSDILNITRFLDTISLIFVMLLCCFFSLFLVLAFLRFDFFQKFLNIRPQKKSYFIYVVRFFMLNYDFIFVVLNIIAFHSFPCRTITYLKKPEIDANYLEEESFQSVEELQFNINTDGVEAQKSVISLSNSVECGFVNHILLASIGAIILMSNLANKLIISRMMKFVPCKDTILSKYGESDIFFDILLFLVMICSSLSTIFFSDNYFALRIIYLIYLFLFLGVYTINHYFRPFFNNTQHYFKSFQILYLINLTCFSIIVRESNFMLIKTEVSTMILMMISLSVLLRLNKNLSRIDRSELFKVINCNNLGQRGREQQVIKVYFILINYIDDAIKIELGQKTRSHNQRIALSIEYLKLSH